MASSNVRTTMRVRIQRIVAIVATTGATLGTATALAPPASAVSPGLTWTNPQLIDREAAGLSSVSCVSSIRCVALDSGGGSFTFNGSTWIETAGIPGVWQSSEEWHNLSCPTASFCMAAGPNDNGDRGLYSTFDGTSWSAAGVANNAAGISGLSCSSPAFCVAVEGRQAQVYNGVTWSSPTTVDATPSDEGTSLSVSCASSSFCVAVVGIVDLAGGGRTGEVSYYNGTTWSAPVSFDSAGSPVGVSCVSSAFCVAADLDGFGGGMRALTYNGSSWTAPVPIGTAGIGNQISCSSTTRCIALDFAGHGFAYGVSTAKLRSPVLAN